MQHYFNRKWAIPAVIIFVIGLYYVPPIHSRLAWRLDSLRTNIKYMINPPDQAVFQPSQQTQINLVVTQMMQTLVATLTPQASSSTIASTIDATSTPQAGPTARPAITSTPLPATVMLSGVKYETQHGRLNYCGPTNFSMALTYWGWNGNRDVIGKAVMPINQKDKNVMPYELQDYITDNVSGITSVIRYGGDIDLLKRMVAAGFPVVTEKGIYEVDMNGKNSWMGHYAFVTGYDETQQELIYQDSYETDPTNPGPNRHIKYSTFIEGWRAFNYVFVVVYPVDKQNQVMSLLGPLEAYFYSNRFSDVINLASTTLNDTIAEPDLEESLYWRGQAYYMAGKTDLAEKDYRGALKVHPKWIPATEALQDLGLQP